MNIIRMFIISGITCIGIIIFTACKSKPKTTPTIFTGEKKEVLKQTIPSSGGEVLVNKPGDPLDGLKITIPENSYTGSRSFHITYETITNHKLGKYFNPLTPLISITNGGGYADAPMILTIPVKVPEGEFAMAFLYNKKTGKLEGMPLLASDNEKVVVMTRWFGMPEEKESNALEGVQTQTWDYIDPEDAEKIILTAARKEDLENDPLADYDSGFRPGVDDFSTTNWGSGFAPSGHCVGQSVSMMWYYLNKKKEGEPPLYKLLDNDGSTPPTPDFWQDDALAIRMNAVIQKEYTAATLIQGWLVGFQVLAQMFAPTDNMTMNAFRYAIKLTKEPQLVMMLQARAAMGHAMVVYNILDQELCIADPNFPGKTNRRIKYEENRKEFIPYLSGINAGALNISFPFIMYIGKRTIFSWPTIQKHWKEIENKTIGKNKFPEFKLVALNEAVEFVPLEDGFNVPDGQLKVMARGGKNNTIVYDAKGKSLLTEEDGSVSLPVGDQTVGIQVVDMGGKWVDYQKIRVHVDKNEKTTSGKGPEFGKLRVTLRIDGQPIIIDQSRFGINPSIKYFEMTGYGLLPAFEGARDGDRSALKIIADGWEGAGRDDKVTAFWRDETGTTYSAQRNGTMTIIQWAPDKLEGTFSFTLKEENVQLREPLIKRLEGSIRYAGKVE